MSFGVVTAYRLVIEGLGIEAVTDPAMERLSPDNSRYRIVGLLREGLRISEQCDPANAEIDASGMTVSIVDRQEDQVWGRHLARQPGRRTWLTADLDDTSTTVTVSSSEGISTNDVIHIGTESMLVAGVASATSLDVSGGRAWWQTIAQYHYTANGDTLVLPGVSLTHPTSLEGRRAYLYRYVDGDSLQGAGTLIGRFIVSTEPRLEDDGGTWTITLDSIVSILKQPLASDTEEPISIRGAYYPRGAGQWRLHEMVSFITVDTFRRAEVSMFGHFETQEDFCAALQAVLRAAMNPLTGDDATVDISAWESTGFGGAQVITSFFNTSRTNPLGVFVVPTLSGWQLLWTTDLVNPAHLVLGMTGRGSEIDGGLPGGIFGDILDADYTRVPGIVPAAGVTLSATTLRGGMPRTSWGQISPTARPETPGVDLSSWDLFVSSATTAITGIDLEWKDGGDPSGFSFGVDSTPSNGRIRVQPAGADVPVRFSYPGRDVEIKGRRTIAIGNLADFRDGLVALAPELANRGALPFVTSSDLASFTTVVAEAAAGRPFARRLYQTAGEVELDEMISHDCRLISVFPRLDEDGKIALTHLRLPTGTSVGDFVIDESTVLVSDQPPTWERSAVYGSINVVKIRTLYDVLEEEHIGTTYVVNDVTAQSLRKAPKELEIAPLSSEAVRDSRTWSYDIAVGVARRVLAIFGRPYSVATIAVPHTLLTTALCGTVAVVTSPRIPDPSTGERGIIRKGGLVVGREWDLATETGVLTLLIADTPIAGYAPSVFVSSSTVVSGNQYDLVVSFDDPSGANMAPASADLSDFYAVGDVLRLLVWDSTTQSPQGCVIDAIDDGGSELRVTFGAPPTLTGTRYLAFALYDAGLTSSQRRFAFFADGSRLLDDGLGGLDSAREYAA